MEKLTQIGNFAIYMECDEPVYKLHIKSVSGNWEVVYRNDTAIHALIIEMLKKKDFNIVHTIISYLFVASNIIPDYEFLGKFNFALEELQTRIPKKEDNEKISEIEVKAAEIMDEQ